MVNFRSNERGYRDPGSVTKLTKINKNSHFLVIFWSLIGEMTQNSVGIGPHTVGMART